MEVTPEILESVGLIPEKKAPRKRKPARPKSAVEKLIPSKKGKGHWNAAVKQCIAWIGVAAESFPSKDEEEISPVICLPCLEIKLEKPPESRFPEKLVGVTPSRSPTHALHSQRTPLNGVARGATVLKVVAIRDGVSLDRNLVAWMKMAFGRYIILAGQKPSCGRAFGYRLAQVAVCLDVMADGTERTMEVFPDFVGALFELVDVARSTEDLDLLGFILKNTVYLDVLAEVAEFKTHNGLVSVNFQNHYDDRYLVFDAANDLLKRRTKS